MQGRGLRRLGVHAVERGLARERAAVVGGPCAGPRLPRARRLLHLRSRELRHDVVHAPRLRFHRMLRRGRRQAELRAHQVLDGLERRRWRWQRVEAQRGAEHAVGYVFCRWGRRWQVLHGAYCGWSLHLVVDSGVPIQRGAAVGAVAVEAVARDALVVAVGGGGRVARRTARTAHAAGAAQPTG